MVRETNPQCCGVIREARNHVNSSTGDFERVYALVRQIPRGRVAPYGWIARWLGWPHGARTVGWALRALRPGTDVPWHRVVNAQGRISLADARAQRMLLEAEGVVFDATGRIDLTTYAWKGPDAPTQGGLDAPRYPRQ